MRKQKSRQDITVTSLKTETAEILAALKAPPIPDSPIIKLWIEILEEGGSLEDFRWGSFDWLLETAQYFRHNMTQLVAIQDRSIATKLVMPIPLQRFPVPRAVLRELYAYLKVLADRRDEYGARLSTRAILNLLPYWPYAMMACDVMSNMAKLQIKGWNKRRWANTLRDLQATDCPLGDKTRKHAIYQYRMALAVADEVKDLPRVFNALKRRLKLPDNDMEKWASIVTPLVNYLSPFFPVTRNGKRYMRVVKIGRHVEREAISRATFQITANILHRAYYIYWPERLEPSFSCLPENWEDGAAR